MTILLEYFVKSVYSIRVFQQSSEYKCVGSIKILGILYLMPSSVLQAMWYWCNIMMAVRCGNRTVRDHKQLFQ